MNGPETVRTAGEIITIAIPRSGTNFLCECIADFSGVLGLFEIFNARGVFGAKNSGLLDALNRELGAQYKEVSDPGLVELFRSQPLVAVEHLRRATAARGFSFVSYKVFPGQVGDDELSELLSNRSCRVLVLTRRRLDVYISYVKARELDVWKSASTAHLLPEIDVGDFLRWCKRTDEWYEHAKALLDGHGTPYAILRYEDDISLPKKNVVELVGRTLTDLRLDVGPPPDKPVRFRRQDKRVGPFKKIANGDEVRAQLRERKKYNYALARPLDDDEFMIRSTVSRSTSDKRYPS